MSSKREAIEMATSEPEPQYGREVFERLRQTMDFVEVLGSDGRPTLVVTSDGFIKPNYEIRDDGVYLKDQPLDSLNWLPACELDGRDAPDPLCAAALPFRFAARHFAAFVLDGYGAFLGERFGMLSNDLSDEDAIRHLGGLRDAKAREVVLATRKLLLEAQDRVAKSDPMLQNAKRELDMPDAHAKHRAAKARAFGRYDWHDQTITEELREHRRRQYSAAMLEADAELRNARLEAETIHAVWRKAMVTTLLTQSHDKTAESAVGLALEAPAESDRPRVKNLGGAGKHALSAEQAAEAMRLLNEGHSVKSVREKFGVCDSTIRRLQAKQNEKKKASAFPNVTPHRIGR